MDWTALVQPLEAHQDPRGSGAVRRSNRQEREAFEAEMVPHLQAAYRLARALTGHEQDAEDLVQEAYLRAYTAFGRYQRGTNARAWLLTILRRIYLNGQRRANRRPLTFPLSGVHESREPVDLSAPDPEAQVEQAADRQAVLDALAQLPEAFRSVLALVDLDGMRYAEAAAVLDCPIGTVMSRLHRGRLELARRLQARRTQREAG